MIKWEKVWVYKALKGGCDLRDECRQQYSTFGVAADVVLYRDRDTDIVYRYRQIVIVIVREREREKSIE